MTRLTASGKMRMTGVTGARSREVLGFLAISSAVTGFRVSAPIVQVSQGISQRAVTICTRGGPILGLNLWVLSRIEMLRRTGCRRNATGPCIPAG